MKIPVNEHVFDDSKFKIGQFVHYKLFYPENALGEKQPTSDFRTGDYKYSSKAKQLLILYI